LGRCNPMLTVVPDGCPGREGGKDASSSLIDEIVREGARRMLPRSAHPGADKALAGIWGAGDTGHARAAVRAFRPADGLKFPGAVAKITSDLDELPAFGGYPAGPRVHLRTASSVELAVATVRHRTRVTTGPGSGAAGLAMAFTLIQAAQDHGRMVSAPHLAALVRAGARSRRGVLAGRPGPASA
jgi:putative transposase